MRTARIVPPGGPVEARNAPSQIRQRRLFGIVEDDAKRMAVATAHAADSMAQIHAVGTACALHGPMRAVIV
jgi:hypothetical protein